MGLSDRIKSAWNAFRGREPTMRFNDRGYISSIRPDRVHFTRGNERSIVSSIYNRLAIDAAAITIEHVQLDKNDRYLETRKSGLNYCLNVSANQDQTGRAFRQDICISMFDEGVVAIVPTDCSANPYQTSSYSILAMRTGQIVAWYPHHVRVRVFNEEIGRHEELIVPKDSVCIIENPLYAVMNEPNSTLKRLLRKLIILDAIDEQSGSGKLDLIIQLPYLVRGEKKKKEAKERIKDIELQLSGSKYGVAYVDATEKIVQLNRSVENNLMHQIEYLTSMLYSQLGLSENVFNGTADEKELLNYYNRTIEPIVSAIVDEMNRKFLTPTARTQKQSIRFFRNPFKLVPINDLAELADKFTRNEIMTSNEFRQILGMKPVSDPKADQLNNSNMPGGANDQPVEEENTDYYQEE